MARTTGGEGGPALAPSALIFSAFALGMATAIAFRVLIILQHIAPAWVRPVWYFAVIGNLVFFFYRFRISQKRKRTVDQHGLISKIGACSGLSPADQEALLYLLRSIKRSPENINYLVITVVSIAAIGIDLGLFLL